MHQHFHKASSISYLLFTGVQFNKITTTEVVASTKQIKYITKRGIYKSKGQCPIKNIIVSKIHIEADMEATPIEFPNVFFVIYRIQKKS